MSVIVSILDAVTVKMFEDLKNQMDNLAQEVALLKEQQALQTGECSCLPLGRSAPETGSGQGSRQAAPAQSPARPRAPAVGPTL